MNKRTVSLITALLCAMASVSWGQSYWKRIYNESPGGSNAYAITPTSDGNFIIVGSTIMKITPFGDSLWAKSYGWTKSYGVIASAITPTPDGNFIVAGYTFSFDNTSRKVYLLKITTNGDTLWTKTYGGNGVAGGNSITPTSDGNFIVVGYTNSFSAGDSCVYLLKITANGDTLWTKTFGENDKESGNAIAPTLDNNFIVAGCTGAFGYDVYLLKVTLNGDTLWTKTYSNSVGGGNAIQPTSDGDDIIVEGYITGSVGLLKIKSNGDTVWTKFIGVYDIVNFASDYYTVSSYSVIPTVDGKFIVTGSFASVHQPGPPVAYILKINSKGEMLWSKTYSPYENEARAVAPTLDGNFIVTGIGDFFGGIMCLYIINDRYTQKDSLFTFKIPVSDDSLNYTFSPIKVPFGMTVSQGGTISWTPKTDSVFMEHVAFWVINGNGKKDSLTFNIFVNSPNKPAATNKSSRIAANSNHAFCIRQASSSLIKFTLPPGVSSIDIYNINGCRVQQLKPVGAQALWNGVTLAGSPLCAGRYFAKFTNGKTSRVGEFTVVR